jgi:hypothetical protein
VVLDESRWCWMSLGGVGLVQRVLDESRWCWMSPGGVG